MLVLVMVDIYTLSAFQKQKTIMILDYFDGFGFTDIYNNSLFTIATAAIAKIQLYYEKCLF